MYSTSVKIYTPRQTVVLYSGSSPRRYQTVYSRNLKIHKGIDNQLQFQFINQDQKPVNITGKTLSCRILNKDNTVILLQKALTPVYPLTGIAVLNLTMSESLKLDTTLCNYSITIPDGEFDYPVYTDDNSGGNGIIDVTEEVMPRYVRSGRMDMNTEHSTPSPSNQVTYYTYGYQPSDNPDHTVQVTFDEFEGTFNLQGSVSGLDGEWYDITDPEEYSGYTSTDYFTYTGFHKFVRCSFTSTGGTAGNVLIR